MAFNIFKWLLKPSATDAKASVGSFIEDNSAGEAGTELWLREMAFWACVKRIGTAVAACEFKTYRRGKAVKSDEYWSWNTEPNVNQTADQFFQEFVGRLLCDQEVLVVSTPGGRYVADSFTTTSGICGDSYSDVAVWGTTTLPGTFEQREVLHIKLDGDRLCGVLEGISAAQGRLIDSAVSAYIKGHGHRGILHIDDTVNTSESGFEERYRELVTNKFKSYFTAENAVLPLFSGYTYEDKSDAMSSQSSRDIRSMMDDVLELTAQALGVPLSIVKGAQCTDEDFSSFMTFAVKPVVDMIKQEINRKQYGQALVSAGTYLDIDMGPVRYQDIFERSNGADKLIGSGVCSINDIMIRLGLSAIDEPWADKHWMTKNYSTAGDLMTAADDSTSADI